MTAVINSFSSDPNQLIDTPQKKQSYTPPALMILTSDLTIEGVAYDLQEVDGGGGLLAGGAS